MNMWVRDSGVNSASDFLSEASFCRPSQLVPSAWFGHAPFAFYLMSILRPRSVVELGVHSGFSYLTFCQAVEEFQLDCGCSGIDTWQGDEHAGFYGNDVYDRLVVNHQCHKDYSRLIRATFDEALSEFADGSIDLLHIDGRHHYGDVRNDFESWKRKLSSRAIVLFHDTNVAEFGVGRLWDELSEDYPHFEFLHSHGLGVLGYGSDIPLKLRQLFLAGNIESSAAVVRATYERLGNSIIDQIKIAELERELYRYSRSMSWRVTRPLRGVSGWARSATASIRSLAGIFTV